MSYHLATFLPYPMDQEPWPILRFLSGQALLVKTNNRLPHWQQEERACFITFRLGDSIPVDVFRKWKEEKEKWLLDHPEPWSEEAVAEYREIRSRMEGYLDEGHGSCLLKQERNSAVLAESLAYHDRERYLLHAWVIMPNHLHVLLSLHPGIPLEGIVASWKKFSARRVNEMEGRSGPLWQGDYFDRLIRDWDHFMNVARYIRRNPAKAKLPDGGYRLYMAKWVEALLA